MLKAHINAWLESAALPKGLPRTLSPEGYWRAGVAGTVLTLALDSETETLFVHAPLFEVRGGEGAGFYRALLAMQAGGELPEGMMFGYEDEAARLTLFGRFALMTLNAARFEGLLRELIALLWGLPERMRAEARRAEASGGKPPSDRPPAAPAATPADGTMTDGDLLELRLLEAMRV